MKISPLLFMNIIQAIKARFTKKQAPLSFYQAIGEEQGIYNLVKNFYEIMETDPKAKDCLNTHEMIGGKVPDEVKKKLFLFLVGWFGGPQTFTQTYGPPRMRARHGHVKISRKEAEQWIYCMEESLKKQKISAHYREKFLNSFWALATRIENSTN